MSNNSIKIISTDDLLIELQHNPNITKKPYLFKLYSYNDYTEIRLSSEDMLYLSESIANFAINNTKNRSINNTKNRSSPLQGYQNAVDISRSVEKLYNEGI